MDALSVKMLRLRVRAEARALRDAEERVNAQQWMERQAALSDEYHRAVAPLLGGGAQKSAVIPSGWRVKPGTKLLVRDDGGEA